MINFLNLMNQKSSEKKFLQLKIISKITFPHLHISCANWVMRYIFIIPIFPHLRTHLINDKKKINTKNYARRTRNFVVQLLLKNFPRWRRFFTDFFSLLQRVEKTNEKIFSLRRIQALIISFHKFHIEMNGPEHNLSRAFVLVKLSHFSV